MVVMVDTEKKKEPTNSQRPMLVVLPRTMSPFLYASMMPWGRGYSDHQALWGNGAPAPKHTHTHTYTHTHTHMHRAILVTTLISACLEEGGSSCPTRASPRAGSMGTALSPVYPGAQISPGYHTGWENSICFLSCSLSFLQQALVRTCM